MARFNTIGHSDRSLDEFPGMPGAAQGSMRRGGCSAFAITPTTPWAKNSPALSRICSIPAWSTARR